MNRRGFLKGAIAAAVVGPAVAKEALSVTLAPSAPPNAVLVYEGPGVFRWRIIAKSTTDCVVSVIGLDENGNPMTGVLPLLGAPLPSMVHLA